MRESRGCVRNVESFLVVKVRSSPSMETIAMLKVCALICKFHGLQTNSKNLNESAG
jgi:hypothetical protein